MKNRFNIFLIALLFCGGAFAGLLDAVAVYASQNDERVELQKQLDDLEAQIDGYEIVVQSKQKQATSLERDISIFNAQISKTQLLIKSNDLKINDLSQDISFKVNTIGTLAEKIEDRKDSIAEILRQTKEADEFSGVEIILGYDNLSDFFTNVDSYDFLQKKLRDSLDDLKNIKTQTEKEKDDLEDRKIETARVKLEQEREKAFLTSVKAEKNNILKQTKNEEAKYKVILEEKKQTAAEIRSRIYRLAGDIELPFGEAVKIAQTAEKLTGVRAALILAILAQESSLDGYIGRNLGQCHYNDPRNNRSGTVMSNSQKPSFLAIMKEIGRDPNTTPVSCPIASDGAYGGAMGPAQFMPVTWWDVNNETGYKNRIASLTGNKPPSPFNNMDAFVGTGLYLKDAYNSSSCVSYAEKNQKVLPYQYLRERCTAARYYAGGNWYSYRLSYGDRVAERTEQYQKDIDIIK